MRTMRFTALPVLTAFLFSCTQQVPRESIEVRSYRVDWDALGAETLQWDGVAVRGVVLTPAQWPLEGSLKRLLDGDFLGVIDALELSFQPSTIPEGVLRELFDKGFLPAYLRVHNTADEPRVFTPLRLAVQVNGLIYLQPVQREELPRHLREIDWMRTGTAVAVVALIVVLLVVAAKEGRGSGSKPGYTVDLLVQAGGQPSQLFGSPSPRVTAPPSDTGLLEEMTLQPGESREGFLLFRAPEAVQDWSTARLALNR